MVNQTYVPEGMLIGKAENREYISSVHGLERAKSEGRICEAIATLCDSETYDLQVDLGEVVGIIPKEESVYHEPIKEIAIITRVGKPVAFKVLSLYEENGQKKALLSRKEAQRECMEQYLMDCIPGDIIPAKITHFENFGAFVDIGCGIISLLPIDCISLSRISHPSERFYLREEIYVIIKNMDYEQKRIYVSTKELFGTWEENAEQFKIGQTVPGIVRSVEEYGIFIELAPNLAGLAEVKENVYEGEECAVYIKNICPEKMKIKLVLIDSYQSEEETAKRLSYFIDPTKIAHLDTWQYSPKNASKTIETNFSET